jgi:single-strand DNA-binding protein
MPSFNKVILAGNLTRDPELRYTPKGTAVCKIGLAMNRKWTAEDGQQREEVTFVDCDFFGAQAEAISQYKKKGHAVLVEGRLKLDQWDDKQTNQKRSKLGVVGEQCTFLDGGGDRDGGHDQGREFNRPSFRSPRPSTAYQGRPDQTRRAAAPPPPSDDMPPDAEDDVPF